MIKPKHKEKIPLISAASMKEMIADDPLIKALDRLGAFGKPKKVREMTADEELPSIAKLKEVYAEATKHLGDVEHDHDGEIYDEEDEDDIEHLRKKLKKAQKKTLKEQIIERPSFMDDLKKI